MTRRVKIITQAEFEELQKALNEFMESVRRDIKRRIYISRNQMARYLDKELTTSKCRVKKIYKTCKEEPVSAKVFEDIQLHINFKLNYLKNELDYGLQITREEIIECILKIVVYSRTIIDDIARDLDSFARLNRWEFSKEFIIELAEQFFVENTHYLIVQNGELVSSMPDDSYAEWIFEKVRMR